MQLGSSFRLNGLVMAPLLLLMSGIAGCSGGSGSDGGADAGADGGTAADAGGTCSLAGGSLFLDGLAQGSTTFNESFTGIDAGSCPFQCSASYPCGQVVPVVDASVDLHQLNMANTAYLLNDSGYVDGASGDGIHGSSCAVTDSLDATTFSGVETVSHLSLQFMDGGATGTQTIRVTAWDGGLVSECSYRVVLALP